MLELQQQYTNYKNSLQQLAQRIGDIEQDAEEHKYVESTLQSPSPNTVVTGQDLGEIQTAHSILQARTRDTGPSAPRSKVFSNDKRCAC